MNDRKIQNPPAPRKVVAFDFDGVVNHGLTNGDLGEALEKFEKLGLPDKLFSAEPNIHKASVIKCTIATLEKLAVTCINGSQRLDMINPSEEHNAFTRMKVHLEQHFGRLNPLFTSAIAYENFKESESKSKSEMDSDKDKAHLLTKVLAANNININEPYNLCLVDDNATYRDGIKDTGGDFILADGYRAAPNIDGDYLNNIHFAELLLWGADGNKAQVLSKLREYETEQKGTGNTSPGILIEIVQNYEYYALFDLLLKIKKLIEKDLINEVLQGAKLPINPGDFVAQVKSKGPDFLIQKVKACSTILVENKSSRFKTHEIDCAIDQGKRIINVISQNQSLSASYLSRAWNHIKQHPWQVLGAALLGAVVATVAVFAVGSVVGLLLGAPIIATAMSVFTGVCGGSLMGGIGVVAAAGAVTCAGTNIVCKTPPAPSVILSKAARESFYTAIDKEIAQVLEKRKLMVGLSLEESRKHYRGKWCSIYTLLHNNGILTVQVETKSRMTKEDIANKGSFACDEVTQITTEQLKNLKNALKNDKAGVNRHQSQSYFTCFDTETVRRLNRCIDQALENPNMPDSNSPSAPKVTR